MRIIYKNELGAVTLCGGGEGDWRITAVHGLGLAPKAYTVVRYAGADGGDTIGEVVNVRTITVSGDVRSAAVRRRELSRAARVFNKKGVLTVISGNVRRRIDCRATRFEAEDKNAAAAPFVLQFSADDPAFSDIEASVVPIFRRENLIASPFTLPKMFSRRTTEADVINLGDMPCEPVLTIYGARQSGATLAGGDEYIAIANAANSQEIRLSTGVLAEETIAIDIPKRRITSDVRGDLMAYLDGGSYLSDFWLEPGVNHISAHSSDANAVMVCEFMGRYVAMM